MIKRKKPYTKEELFNTIVEELKRKNQLPDILDYDLATHDEGTIERYDFDFANHLKYGSNEGIYLTMYIQYREVNESGRYELVREHIGTFKTLIESPEAMRTMGILLADFVVAGKRFVDDNIDDFTWEGYNIRGFKEDGEPLAFSYDVYEKEKIIDRARGCFKSDAVRVEITDYKKHKVIKEYTIGLFDMEDENE